MNVVRTAVTTGGAWVRFPYRRPPDPAARLFCLPFAGGSAMAFRHWLLSSDETLEVAAIQLPGRGDRAGEPALSGFADVVERLRAEIEPHLDRPYALYGHSMGAHLGLALARSLAARPPVALFVGASTAPARYRSQPPQVRRDDATLLSWLRGLGGTPEAVLSDPEWHPLILPPLRADLALLDDSRRHTGPPVAHRIHAFVGDGDPLVPPDSAAGWAAETTAASSCEVVAGGHLFLEASAEVVLQRIRQHLRG